MSAFAARSGSKDAGKVASKRATHPNLGHLFIMCKTEQVVVSDVAILASSTMLLLCQAGQSEFQCGGDDGDRKK